MEKTFLKGQEKGRAAGREEGREEGRAQERAQLIVSLLEKRGVPVQSEHRERIMSCTDLETLGGWWDQALIVEESGELFGERHEPQG
ncbi:hypothetical protein [Streptomyces jumonjinensis]|uniref:hypothetical protein n=1 Tax=Streptomyces jumonjinensis TaxID=1945 RepID=UPI0037BC21F5